ncbi:MAG: EFR1 family ferrodoxin [Synergistaceae bacterium]|nr:EFR1 family ferrodoxin [Synergistaceae bacterium]
MAEIQGLEFRTMCCGQGEEVCRLVSEVIKAGDGGDGKSVFTPDECRIVGRYAAPEAIERRISMGYRHELVYVSGVLAGMIETKGPDRISMLYVRPAYAGKGLGSRLIARAAARCAAESPKANKALSVYAADNAIRFYERVGFVRGGERKVVGGVHSSLYKLPLARRERILSSKMHAGSVDLFVFTGTGNSLLVAQAAAETLKQEGLLVRLRSMDAPCPNPFLSEETALGLAFPVASLSTYPAVWRFIESLPAGYGREAFVMGTCGGFPGGMQGPLGKVLREKGYNPIAAKFFIMPSNYANKKLPVEKNAARVEKALLEASSFARDLLKGQTEWSNGIPLLSGLMYRLGQTRKPWNFFYRLFPIAADPEKCTRCGLCVRNCPAQAVTMPAGADGCPVVERGLCESCQRCVGFCPAGALRVPGKPAEPYRAMSYEDFKAAFD